MNYAVSTVFKKMSWALLYLAAFIPLGFSLYYFSEKNLFSALVAFSVSMSAYTFLVVKDLKFLSSASFLTLFFASLMTLGIAANKSGGVFLGAFDEKAGMLVLSLAVFFLLINSVFWIKIKRGFKKIMSLVFISLSVLMLIVFGTVPPDYHQNFIYTRINILILLALGVFLMVKKRKILGILGILLSIGILLFSAVMFAGKTYVIEGREQEEVIAFVGPRAKEMLDYYNREDYGNFCKYCGLVLKNMVDKNPVKDKRDAYGPYVYLGEPDKVIRKGGRYYMEYPVKFQNVEGLVYFIVVIESIYSDPSIYGFAFSGSKSL